MVLELEYMQRRWMDGRRGRWKRSDRVLEGGAMRNSCAVTRQASRRAGGWCRASGLLHELERYVEHTWVPTGLRGAALLAVVLASCAFGRRRLGDEAFTAADFGAAAVWAAARPWCAALVAVRFASLTFGGCSLCNEASAAGDLG